MKNNKPTISDNPRHGFMLPYGPGSVIYKNNFPEISKIMEDCKAVDLADIKLPNQRVEVPDEK